MRFVLLSVLTILFLTSCNHKPGNEAGANGNDSTFTLTGNISGIDTGRMIFLHRVGDDKVYDTAQIVKGAFEFKGKIFAEEGMAAYTCFIDGRNDDRTTILIENAKMQFTAKADSFDNAVASGSMAQDDYNAFGKLTASIDSATNVLGKAYSATSDKVAKDSLGKIYDQYDSILQTMVPAFVKTHNRSYGSAYIITRTLLVQPKLETLEPVYNSLDSTIKQSKQGKIIADVIEAVKKTSVGQMAPDFTMNDRDGKPVALSSLRGKYIFLDFWASWCGPCRRENPNIVAAYAKFHSPKFDILGVSLDSKKDKWEEAITKDKLTWNHVSDLKGWGNTAAKTYGIRAIPANLLLDKDGKILARNLYGDDLDKKLAEVLK